MCLYVSSYVCMQCPECRESISSVQAAKFFSSFQEVWRHADYTDRNRHSAASAELVALPVVVALSQPTVPQQQDQGQHVTAPHPLAPLLRRAEVAQLEVYDVHMSGTTAYAVANGAAHITLSSGFPVAILVGQSGDTGGGNHSIVFVSSSSLSLPACFHFSGFLSLLLFRPLSLTPDVIERGPTPFSFAVYMDPSHTHTNSHTFTHTHTHTHTQPPPLCPTHRV
jgi:hypothetical protein